MRQQPIPVSYNLHIPWITLLNLSVLLLNTFRLGVDSQKSLSQTFGWGGVFLFVPKHLLSFPSLFNIQLIHQIWEKLLKFMLNTHNHLGHDLCLYNLWVVLKLTWSRFCLSSGHEEWRLPLALPAIWLLHGSHCLNTKAWLSQHVFPSLTPICWAWKVSSGM